MQIVKRVMITRPYDKLPALKKASFKEVNNTEENEILVEIVKRMDVKDTSPRDFVTRSNEKFRFRYIGIDKGEHIVIQQKLHTEVNRLIAFGDRYVRIQLLDDGLKTKIYMDEFPSL